MPIIETRRIRGGVLSIGDGFIIAFGVGLGIIFGGFLFYVIVLGFSARAGWLEGKEKYIEDQARLQWLQQTYEENTQTGDGNPDKLP